MITSNIKTSILRGLQKIGIYGLENMTVNRSIQVITDVEDLMPELKVVPLTGSVAGAGVIYFVVAVPKGEEWELKQCRFTTTNAINAQLGFNKENMQFHYYETLTATSTTERIVDMKSYRVPEGTSVLLNCDAASGPSTFYLTYIKRTKDMQ